MVIPGYGYFIRGAQTTFSAVLRSDPHQTPESKCTVLINTHAYTFTQRSASYQ